MSFINTQDLVDFGGKTILCTNVYAQINAPEQVGYNTPLGNGVGILLGAGGGGSTSPGGLNGQVQFNANGIFGGLANSALTALIQSFSATTSGAVPASGGGTINFLRADGSWVNPAGAPGGSSGQVQFNSGGSFGGLTNTQLTANINIFTSALSGAVPASGGGTTNFMRADGTWAAPSGNQAPVQRSATSSSAAQPLSSDMIINLNVTTAISITLPLASTRAGKRLTFVDVGLQTGAHNITITPASGDTIVNWSTPTSLVMDSNGMSISLFPFNDGVNVGWFIS